jgi:hypothetical protein
MIDEVEIKLKIEWLWVLVKSRGKLSVFNVFNSF